MRRSLLLLAIVLGIAYVGAISPATTTRTPIPGTAVVADAAAVQAKPAACDLLKNGFACEACLADPVCRHPIFSMPSAGSARRSRSDQPGGAANRLRLPESADAVADRARAGEFRLHAHPSAGSLSGGEGSAAGRPEISRRQPGPIARGAPRRRASQLGVNETQFNMAVAFIRQKSRAQLLSIVGPTFSGSLDSLRELLVKNDHKFEAVRIESGTATSFDSIYATAWPAGIQFHTFQENDCYAMNALARYGTRVAATRASCRRRCGWSASARSDTGRSR
jgi:hypothetical protein